MNFRKTVRSTYQHQSQSQSVKKIQFNPDDLKDCNLYTDQAQSTKESESNSILNRLLLQPPSMKQNSQKKLSLLPNKKYEPKFQKPDVQNVIQENINLKNIIQTNNHTISTLKVKNIELEKKIKFLQKGLEKFEKQSYPESVKNKTEFQDEMQQKDTDKKTVMRNNNQQHSAVLIGKPAPIHTQILKKKISQLSQLNMQFQNQLSFLKKLPNSTIYQQNDVQKQHLMAQTIRLKSIITSLSQQLHQISSTTQTSDKFQNQFMRLMKEQNQKLKATVRLLENDKILLKSRQAIMGKLNSDLKREIEQLKSKLLYKQSELEKINNENKNLLFKKTNQYKLQQQKKQSQIIQDLKLKLTNAENEVFRLEETNDFHNDQNISLKEKQKILQDELTQLEIKHDSMVKKLNEENQQLQFQLKNLKNDYINLLNANALKKKKSSQIPIQQQTVITQGYQRRDSNKSAAFRKYSEQVDSVVEAFNRQDSYPPVNSDDSKDTTPIESKRQKSLISNFPEKSIIYARPVKWEEIQLPLTHLYVFFEANTSHSVDSILETISQDNKIKCGDLISLFAEEPFNINKKDAIKLARYIVEEETSRNQRVAFDQNISTEKSLAKQIILSSLQKINQKLSSMYSQRWRIIFERTKKLQQILKEELQNMDFMRKQKFTELVDKGSRQKVEAQDYDFVCTKCFDKAHSDEQFTLSRRKLIKWIDEMMKPEPKDQPQTSKQ